MNSSNNFKPEEALDSLLPQDLDDTSIIPALAARDADEFGSRIVRPLLRSIYARPNEFSFNEAARELIISRASEDMTIKTIVNTIQPPILDDEDYVVAHTAMCDIIMKLPVEKLRAYGPALNTLAKAKIPEGVAPNFNSLKMEASDVLRFMTDPNAVWVPLHKFDFMAERSLDERLTTAEQIRPLVPELLKWLMDKNWPPYRVCWRHLARYPEEVVRYLPTLLQQDRSDSEWMLNILEFVEECVPIGPMWEGIRPQVQDLMDERSENGDERELAEAAEGWMKKLDLWKNEQAKLPED